MKRSGRKSAAQTPAPKSERIKGSKRNPKGSAASSESANKINLSDNIVAVLKDKADAYNEKHPKNKVSVSTLKAVFRRGAGAYSSSHRPTITGGRPNSRTAWAYARVNKFLLKKGGTKVKAAYVQDDDLMEMGGEVIRGSAMDIQKALKFIVHIDSDSKLHYAPNGKLSKLTYPQWQLVRTRAFKKWFGDWENYPQNSSKVIDENGEPLVVYRRISDDPLAKNPYNTGIKNFLRDLKWTSNLNGLSKTKKNSEAEIGDIAYNISTKKYGVLIEDDDNLYTIKYDDNTIEKSNGFGLEFYSKTTKNNDEDILSAFLNIRNLGDHTKFGNYSFSMIPFSGIKIGEGYITFSPTQQKIADGSNTTFDGNNPDIRYEDGGKIFKPTLSVQDIARKHNVTVSDVLKKLTLGIEKELEHTEDEEVAKIIASHHVEENIEYYDVLKENELEEGAIIEDIVIEEKPKVALPDTYADVESLKGILAMQGYEIKPIVQAENEENEEIMKKGGVVVGKSHQEADENGTGEKFVVASTGQIVELEGGEAVIVNKAMDSSEMLNFEGKEMTPKEIASYLNHAYGGVKFEQGGEVTCGCSHKKYYHGGELPSAVVDGLQGGEAVITKKTMESNEKYMFEGQKLTPRQILSRINHKYGGVSFARGGITGRVKHSEENKMSKMIYFINNVNYG